MVGGGGRGGGGGGIYVLALDDMQIRTHIPITLAPSNSPRLAFFPSNCWICSGGKEKKGEGVEGGGVRVVIANAMEQPTIKNPSGHLLEKTREARR